MVSSHRLSQSKSQKCTTQEPQIDIEKARFINHSGVNLKQLPAFADDVAVKQLKTLHAINSEIIKSGLASRKRENRKKLTCIKKVIQTIFTPPPPHQNHRGGPSDDDKLQPGRRDSPYKTDTT